MDEKNVSFLFNGCTHDVTKADATIWVIVIVSFPCRNRMSQIQLSRLGT